MPFSRFLARTLVAVVASLALVGGVTPLASAADAAARAGTSTMTSAERCAQEKQDVKRAKKRLAAAKKATKHRAAKVKAAKANLRKQKRQRAKWCAQAANEKKASDQADATKAAWDALRGSAPVQALPKDVRKEMFGTVAKVMGLADTLKSQQIPGADAAELDQIVALLQSLDPALLQQATSDFVDKMKSASSKPNALAALIDTLLSGLPAGTTLTPDSDMAKLQKAMQDVIAALQAFQPSGGRTEVDKLVAAIAQATATLQSVSESGSLEQFLVSVTEVNTGDEPTADQFAALFAYLLTGTGTFPFPIPTDVDGLGSLDALLGSVQDLVGTGTPLPGVDALVPLVTDVVDTLISTGTDPADLGGVVDPGGILGDIIGGLPTFP